MSLLDRFVQNAAFLLALALIFDLRGRWLPRGSSKLTPVLTGSFIGLIAIATMLYPVRVEPGLVLDTRGIVIAVGALAFGTLPTLVASLLAGLYRALAIGGPATPVGLSFIAIAAAAGLCTRRCVQRRGYRPLRSLEWWTFALLGLGVGLAQLGLTALLLRGGAAGLMAALTWPVLGVHLVATTALGLVLKARSARLKTERVLAEREATFRSLTEQLPAIVYRAALDETGSALYVSPAIARLGYSQAEWLADPDSFAKTLHPDDAPRVFAEYRDGLADGRAFDLTYRLRTASGEYRVFHDAAQVVRTDEGEALFLQGVMTDITDAERLRESAMLEAAALDAAADAIAITDVAGNFVWVNAAFRKLTGYTLQDTLGRNPRDLIRSGTHDAAFYRQMWETLLAGREWSGQLVNRRKDGSLFHEEQTITPLFGDDGQIKHFIAIKRDITERLALEQQYRQAQKMEGIGRLAGGIAHDLNNLLTVINGTVELVLPGADQVQGLRGDLLQIRRATDRAASLTRQLLAFSRQQVLRIEVLEINRIVDDLVKMLSRIIGGNVTVETHLAPDVGHLRGDAGQMEQVLMNLAINARDAMPGGGTLTISTRDVFLDEAFAASHVTVQPGPHVCIEVRDTGTGMDASTLNRIFEPFFTTKEPGKGTGLGLSTVYGIVKQSGGSIWVDSTPGRGTSFTLYFPRVDEPIRERPSANPPAATDGSGETVLVVEDEAAIRAVAVRVLSKRGYRVLEAESGEDALARAVAHRERIDLLMTDMVMPGMSGPELAQALRARQPSLRVLFTSGYSADAVASQFGLGEEANFMAKPYSLAELAREVRRVLDSTAVRDAG